MHFGEYGHFSSNHSLEKTKKNFERQFPCPKEEIIQNLYIFVGYCIHKVDSNVFCTIKISEQWHTI